MAESSESSPLAFGEIAKSVVALWNFLVAPVAMLIPVLLVARLLWGAAPFTGFLALAVQFARSHDNEATRKAMEFYGLSKLLPFVALLLILMALYIFRLTVSRLGTFLPPNIVTSGTRLARDESLTVFFWCAYPAAEHYELWPLLDAQIEQAKEENKAFVDRYLSSPQRRLSSTYLQFNYCKVLIVWTVFSVLLGPQGHEHHPFKAFFIVLLALTWGAAQVFMRLQYEREEAESKFYLAKILIQRTSGFTGFPPVIVEEKRIALDELVRESERSWKVLLPGQNWYYAWKIRQLRRKRQTV